jgi:hypothetical protein
VLEHAIGCGNAADGTPRPDELPPDEGDDFGFAHAPAELPQMDPGGSIAGKPAAEKKPQTLAWFGPEPERKDRLSVDKIIEQLGRRGGPTRFGWHKRESQFKCARAARFDEVHAEKLEPTLALQVGSIAHEFLAERYTCAKESRPIVESNRKVDQLLALLRDNDWVQVADECWRIWNHYTAKWGPNGELDSYVRDSKVAEVEVHLERTLPWGEPYTARADLVLKAPDGYIIVDHKTSDRNDADFKERWALDPQMLGLAWVASRTYRPIVGYSMNGIVKTLKPDFPRFFFALERDRVRDWLGMMRYRFIERQVAALAGNPPNFAACIGRGRCRWWERCVYRLLRT